ncbi:unnamed protein product [Nesidiocoris tenuis]|uniref:Uncharacterized protein n=1 Tax=Nesidiocoris tenuis TaxID=355587 RepID=A0A6H5G459_9HEMI|nr:unnamed protein product [Nesidiocoris tenuis]
MRVHSAASTEKIVGGASPSRRSAALPDSASGAGPLSCCGNILWFEKCNASEYAAGGHRPTRSDAAKQLLSFRTQLLQDGTFTLSSNFQRDSRTYLKNPRMVSLHLCTPHGTAMRFTYIVHDSRFRAEGPPRELLRKGCQELACFRWPAAGKSKIFTDRSHRSVKPAPTPNAGWVDVKKNCHGDDPKTIFVLRLLDMDPLEIKSTFLDYYSIRSEPRNQWCKYVRSTAIFVYDLGKHRHPVLAGKISLLQDSNPTTPAIGARFAFLREHLQKRL